jgi:hypothetical protein
MPLLPQCKFIVVFSILSLRSNRSSLQWLNIQLCHLHLHTRRPHTPQSTIKSLAGRSHPLCIICTAYLIQVGQSPPSSSTSGCLVCISLIRVLLIRSLEGDHGIIMAILASSQMHLMQTCLSMDYLEYPFPWYSSLPIAFYINPVSALAETCNLCRVCSHSVAISRRPMNWCVARALSPIRSPMRARIGPAYVIVLHIRFHLPSGALWAFLSCVSCLSSAFSLHRSPPSISLLCPRPGGPPHNVSVIHRKLSPSEAGQPQWPC